MSRKRSAEKVRCYGLRLAGEARRAIYREDDLDALIEDIRNSDAGEEWSLLVLEMTEAELEKIPDDFEGW